MAPYNIRCPGVPLGNIFIEDNFVLHWDFRSYEVLQKERKGKTWDKENDSEPTKCSPVCQGSYCHHLSSTAQRLDVILLCGGRGKPLGLHTGNQWHRRIDNRANGRNEILTVCTAETFSRAAAVCVNIYSARLHIYVLPLLPYISVMLLHLTNSFMPKLRR